MFRRITLVTAATAIAAGLALTGCSAGTTAGGTAGGGATTGSSASAAPSAPAAPAAPGLNTPLTVGSFEYTALGVQDIGATAGTSPLTATAQGTFLQVDLKIANTGNSSATFIVNYVKLVDAAGKTYDADASATLYASPDQNAWVAGINPGNAIQGPILFDVPAGTAPASIQVSDNAFAKGKTITLG
ncbi:DUF4352 domain-containing protein [Leifsonia aquatica]|uniref:DUF4352 domain-containing protein n=2 Tax=Leifsonia aquatica TaxID=144185 RepID=A0A7W4UW86_LEIAQ|nr:DUF4352 domain-containing protein [Leifsonia aquatica]MBB2967202.1 hypothetical protein [Leifsonia aquatica]